MRVLHGSLFFTGLIILKSNGKTFPIEIWFGYSNVKNDKELKALKEIIKSFKIFSAVQRSRRHHSWFKVTDQPCQTDWICVKLVTSEQNKKASSYIWMEIINLMFRQNYYFTNDHFFQSIHLFNYE